MNAKTMELAIAATIAYDGDESMLDNAKQYDGMGSMLAPIGYCYEPEPYNMRVCVYTFTFP